MVSFQRIPFWYLPNTRNGHSLPMTYRTSKITAAWNLPATSDKGQAKGLSPKESNVAGCFMWFPSRAGTLQKTTPLIIPWNNFQLHPTKAAAEFRLTYMGRRIPPAFRPELVRAPLGGVVTPQPNKDPCDLQIYHMQLNMHKTQTVRNNIRR